MLRVALAQINPTVGDIKGNESVILDYLKSGEENSAEVVLFPELAITGYPPEDLLFKKDFLKAAWESLERIAACTGSAAAVIGAPLTDNGKLYNGAVVCRNGKITDRVFKTHLPNYGVFDEKRYFTPGHGLRPVEIGSIGAAVTICEDIWEEKGAPAEVSALPEVEFLINISSSPYHTGKTRERREIVKSWAERFRKPVVYCNLVGGQDELVFDGGSFACGAEGEIIASAKEFREDLLLVDIPIREREKESAGISNRITPSLSYPHDVFEALKLGVRDYCEKNGFNKVLIALSGGIDSALTAVIAVCALGAERVNGVALPSRYSSESSLRDAEDLARNLNIRLDVIPITGLMDAFDRSLEEVFAGTEKGLAEENIQARIRGTIIMAISNRFGSLALATGNKSELSVGYCTLYGDMAGGFAVIKDLRKLTVYELARWINSRQDLPDIPESTIVKEPSAELRPGQKDSDSLPPYEILDPILKLYVEKGNSIEEIISLGYSEREVRRVVRLVDLNEYKRRQAAPGVKITPRAFGKDRRMPITNRLNR